MDDLMRILALLVMCVLATWVQGSSAMARPNASVITRVPHFATAATDATADPSCIHNCCGGDANCMPTCQACPVQGVLQRFEVVDLSPATLVSYTIKTPFCRDVLLGRDPPVPRRRR